ncbi:MAG TPA: 3'(2'),5'-bisphosphate nucleotidase CysQ [Stellaceae bacterium]|jgi:3'(2'), 5'-bisphosphate nucleotidase|nr:3'(2'),5'-bisphosphate nucleotidase CysQ [Stellaceae bacterium]
MALDPMLELALRAALAGGEEVMRVYAEPFEVREKHDKTPVTEADLASERVIEKILRDACPDIHVVSEETAEPEGWTAPGPRFWSVDPLDGTREFVNRTDEFAVLIALVEHGRPVLGVVYGPATGVTYAAAGGKAMRRHGAGAFEPIAAREPPSNGIVVVHSRSHENSRRLAEYFEGKPVPVVERKKCGSALKFGVLAAGEADFYPRFGTTMEWDTAAGQAILEAAGGSVVTLSGTPLVYGKPGLKNEGFLAWGKKPAW